MADVDPDNKLSPEERPWQIDKRCDRYEDEWRASRAPRIADYLDGMEGETRTALWLELVMLDQELRRESGEELTLLDDYMEHAPEGMILLDLSTSGPGSIEEVPPALDAVIENGELDADRTLDRSEPIAGEVPSTVGSIGKAAGPGRLPSTIGSPTAENKDGRESLTLARPGIMMGDYVLLEKLGSGGMGVVFKARQRGLKRDVALKMIKAGVLADERHIRLFRSEAEAVAALDHPNIVPILDSGEHEGMLFYSMKLVAGKDLGQQLPRFRDQPEAIARLTARVAEAIAHAHQRGVLHRDLKPSNILVDEHGDPQVIDFGLAKRLDASLETTTGNPVGTPGYMSPEQARGSRVGVTTATDVYGLGTLLYALLTSQPPFSGSSAVEILRQVVDHEPPRPRDRNPQVDRDLEIICLKCLSKEPRDRYASAREVSDDLIRWLEGRPILARPASRVERSVKWVRRHKLTAALG